jgi:hypothetical protein
MGCLNSNANFSHWFGNIHLSGPCNRSCYFCIGQHMMALDAFNVLDTWPLPGISEFVERCAAKGVGEINLTGTNTDPLLYRPMHQLTDFLRETMPEVKLGIRTNGAMIGARRGQWRLFDKASLSIPTFNVAKYQAMMGSGIPPNLEHIEELSPGIELKVNIVLGPENTGENLDDLLHTLDVIAHTSSIKRVNLREPYGQPHIGDPLAKHGFKPAGERLGMPFYIWEFGGIDVMYWDVHYVEVESINLYANGRVSTDYPITRGHSADGKVLGQEHFQISGRQQAQWL